MINIKSIIRRIAWWTIPEDRRFYMSEFVRFLSTMDPQEVQYEFTESSGMLTFALPCIDSDGQKIVIFVHFDTPMDGSFSSFSVKFVDEENNDMGLMFRHNPPAWFPRYVAPQPEKGHFSQCQKPLKEMVKYFVRMKEVD